MCYGGGFCAVRIATVSECVLMQKVSSGSDGSIQLHTVGAFIGQGQDARLGRRTNWYSKRVRLVNLIDDG